MVTIRKRAAKRLTAPMRFELSFEVLTPASWEPGRDYQFFEMVETELRHARKYLSSRLNGLVEDEPETSIRSLTIHRRLA